MSEKKQNNTLPVLAGVCFVLYVLCRVISFLQVHHAPPFLEYILLLGLAVVAFALFTKRRDIVMPAGFAVVTLYSLIVLFKTFSFMDFCSLIGYAGLTFFGVAELTDYLPQLKGKFKKLWFVPVAILAALKLVLVFRYTALDMDYYDIFMIPVFFIKNVVLQLPEIAGVLLSALWIFNPDGLPKQSNNKQNIGGDNRVVMGAGAVSSEAYCGLGKHILLLFFTFGIWFLIWIYRMTRYTNAVKDEEERNPTTKLLLCMFIPFYQIFWTYKTAQRIDKLAKGAGVSSDLSTLCLILAIFIPIIPPILMQDKMNAVVTAKPNTIETAQNEAVSHAQETTLGAADELKKFKELLESGIISQEEFDAKKKQLLGL